MIGQHPQLVGFPELKLFLYPTVGELARRRLRPSRFAVPQT